MGSSPTTTLFTTMSGRTCGLSSALQNILFRDGSHPWSWSHFGEVPSPCRRAAAAPGRERHEDDAGHDVVFIDTTLTTPVVTLQAAQIQRRKVGSRSETWSESSRGGRESPGPADVVRHRARSVTPWSASRDHAHGRDAAGGSQ
jgi:hypothetical protein